MLRVVPADVPYSGVHSDEDLDISVDGGEELPRMIDVEELEDAENAPLPRTSSKAKVGCGRDAGDDTSSRHKEHARILAIQHRWVGDSTE